MATTGKRAGSRRAAPAPRTFNRAALITCAAITLCVIAWGYLVYAAIDFGTAARDGGSAATWALMALACLGAIACLFFGLMLVARLLQVVGITTSDDSDSPPSEPRPPRPAGGKRAAR